MNNETANDQPKIIWDWDVILDENLEEGGRTAVESDQPALSSSDKASDLVPPETQDRVEDDAVLREQTDRMLKPVEHEQPAVESAEETDAELPGKPNVREVTKEQTGGSATPRTAKKQRAETPSGLVATVGAARNVLNWIGRNNAKDGQPPDPLSVEASGTLSRIEELLTDLPKALKNDPKVQRDCLKKLISARMELHHAKTLNNQRLRLKPEEHGSYYEMGEEATESLLRGREAVVDVEISLARQRTQLYSLGIVGAIIYLLLALSYAAYLGNVFGIADGGSAFLDHSLLGIPAPIIIWSLIGSFTSMLLRAGKVPFDNTIQASRWLLFRPIVGTVMGILTYLMVIAGLIVFANTSEPTTKELLWVLAFIGSFSDTLSVGLLEQIAGKLQVSQVSAAQSAKKSPASQIDVPDGLDSPLRVGLE